jgi:xanthine dehydrogenase molybdopterin-binding subunit B
MSATQVAEHYPVASPITKVEAPLQTSGEAKYTADVSLPAGAVHAAFVGTRIARAKINTIDAAAALLCPGVVAVLTAKDIRGCVGM